MIKYDKNRLRNLNYVKRLLENTYIVIQNEGNLQCTYIKHITGIDTSEKNVVLDGIAISIVPDENNLGCDSCLFVSHRISDDIEDLLDLSEQSSMEVFNDLYKKFNYRNVVYV